MTVNGWRGFLLWLVVFALMAGAFMLINSNADRACEQHGGRLTDTRQATQVCMAPDGKVVSW